MPVQSCVPTRSISRPQGEPAQLVRIGGFGQEGGFGEVIFGSNELKGRVGQPCVQEADARRVAPEVTRSEGVDLVIGDAHKKRWVNDIAHLTSKPVRGQGAISRPGQPTANRLTCSVVSGLGMGPMGPPLGGPPAAGAWPLAGGGLPDPPGAPGPRRGVVHEALGAWRFSHRRGQRPKREGFRRFCRGR